MKITLSDEAQKTFARLTNGKNLANLQRAEGVSLARRINNLTGQLLSAHKMHHAPKRRGEIPKTLNRAIVRSEEEIRADLAKMLGAQLQAQMIRWGFV